MGEKEKAKELIDKFQYSQRGFVMPLIVAKQCALICVDEIIVFLNELFHTPKGEIEYWQNVKTEIENFEQ